MICLCWHGVIALVSWRGFFWFVFLELDSYSSGLEMKEMDVGCLLLLYCIDFNFYINLYFYNNFRRYSLLFSVIFTSIHCIHGNVAHGGFHDHIDSLILIYTQNKLFKSCTVISNIWYSGNTQKAKKVVKRDYYQGLRRSKDEWWRTKKYLICVYERLLNTYVHEYLINMYACVLHSCLVPPEVKKRALHPLDFGIR